LWGSFSLAQELMKENLIDGYHIQLCPVLKGGGRKLFPEQIKVGALKLLEVWQYATGTFF
jgi:dihydrofolate reductase